MSAVDRTIKPAFKTIGLAAMIALWTGGCSSVPAFSPQQPSRVQSAAAPNDTLVERQQRTALAHSQLEQTRYEERLAAQDYSNAQAEYKSAQQRMDDLKRRVESTKQAYDAARARTAAAQRNYDQAMRAVDQLFQSAPAPQGGK